MKKCKCVTTKVRKQIMRKTGSVWSLGPSIDGQMRVKLSKQINKNLKMNLSRHFACATLMNACEKQFLISKSAQEQLRARQQDEQTHTLNHEYSCAPLLDSTYAYEFVHVAQTTKKQDTDDYVDVLQPNFHFFWVTPREATWLTDCCRRSSSYQNDFTSDNSNLE